MAEPTIILLIEFIIEGFGFGFGFNIPRDLLFANLSIILPRGKTYYILIYLNTVITSAFI